MIRTIINSSIPICRGASIICVRNFFTNNFVYIYDVEVINPKLAIIEMEVLGKFKGEIPEEFITNTEQEATNLGIDLEELDFIGDNIMVHPKSGKLKMIDV